MGGRAATKVQSHTLALSTISLGLAQLLCDAAVPPPSRAAGTGAEPWTGPRGSHAKSDHIGRLLKAVLIAPVWTLHHINTGWRHSECCIRRFEGYCRVVQDERPTAVLCQNISTD